MTTQKLAIFDWNGTLLADTRIAWVASNKCLEFYGKAPITFEKQLETFDFPIIHYYKNNGVCVDEVLRTKEESNQIFQDAYEPMASKSRTRRGARALLEWLKDNNIDCIILSNYLTEKIEFHLKRLELDHYFSFVSANNCNGTSILNVTNKLERLSEFMVKRGYQPKNAFIIGDSKEEPDIGRHMGVLSIGITGGCINERRLRGAKPDHVIHSLSDVKTVLQKKWNMKP